MFKATYRSKRLSHYFAHLILLFAFNNPTDAAENATANGLLWADDSGKTLFTAADIVRFDWEQQVFELQRERAMDLTAYLKPFYLQRSFSVRDSDGQIYAGQFVSPVSSQSYNGPSIIFGLTEQPPLFRISDGYPGTIGDGGNVRFNQRLHDDLKQAGLLKSISPSDKPSQIERIYTGWFGKQDNIRLFAEIFPETFRLGQSARVHLFFTSWPKPPPAFDTAEIQTTLSQTNGFTCTTDHTLPEKLMRDTIKSGFQLLRWKPWGPILSANPSTATSGPATLSLQLILKRQTTNGLEVIYNASIPPQKLDILP